MNSGTFRWVLFAGICLVVFIISVAVGAGSVALLRMPGLLADGPAEPAPAAASDDELPPQTPAPPPTAVPDATATGTTPTAVERSSPAMLLADDNMFCRAGPGVAYEPEWTIVIGDTVPIVGKYANDWHLVQIDDPRTRTQCCWVGGGVPQGDTSSIPVVSSLPPGGSCP